MACRLGKANEEGLFLSICCSRLVRYVARFRIVNLDAHNRIAFNNYGCEEVFLTRRTFAITFALQAAVGRAAAVCYGLNLQPTNFGPKSVLKLLSIAEIEIDFHYLVTSASRAGHRSDQGVVGTHVLGESGWRRIGLGG